jgi:hypothetical protein
MMSQMDDNNSAKIIKNCPRLHGTPGTGNVTVLFLSTLIFGVTAGVQGVRGGAAFGFPGF